MARPRIIKSPEEFEALAEAYFAKCDDEKQPYTVTGLALALGLSSRDSLCEYGEREEFSDTVKRAKTRVEMAHERNLFNGSCTGSIFALKNFGWTDKQDLGLSGSVDIGLSDLVARVAASGKGDSD